MRTNQEALEHARWRPPDHITIQYTLHNHPVRPVKTTLRPSFPGHLGSTSSWPRPACQFGHTSLQPVHIDITAAKRTFHAARISLRRLNSKEFAARDSDTEVETLLSRARAFRDVRNVGFCVHYFGDASRMSANRIACSDDSGNWIIRESAIIR
jgi:hypothetical protein